MFVAVKAHGQFSSVGQCFSYRIGVAGTAAISIADMDTMHSAEIPFTRLFMEIFIADNDYILIVPDAKLMNLRSRKPSICKNMQNDIAIMLIDMNIRGGKCKNMF